MKVAVVGRCIVGCEHCEGSGCGALYCRVRAPHPTEPAQHTTCSNTRLVLLKMGIMMPETC